MRLAHDENATNEDHGLARYDVGATGSDLYSSDVGGDVLVG